MQIVWFPSTAHAGKVCCQLRCNIISARAVSQFSMNVPSIIETNFNNHVSFLARSTEGMRVFEKPGITYVDSGLRCDTFNIIHIKNGSAMTIEALADTIGHYQARNLPFCIWVSDLMLSDSLRLIFAKLGIREKESEPGMVLDLNRYSPIFNALHDRIVVATTQKEVADYADVISRNWSPPDREVLRYYQRAAPNILANGDVVQLAIAYGPTNAAEGQSTDVLGAVEMFASDSQTAGIYGLATYQAHRGKGVGSALMTFCLNALKKRGIRYVILQASQDGIGIYRRLGFEACATYFEFGPEDDAGQ